MGDRLASSGGLLNAHVCLLVSIVVIGLDYTRREMGCQIEQDLSGLADLTGLKELTCSTPMYTRSNRTAHTESDRRYSS